MKLCRINIRSIIKIYKNNFYLDGKIDFASFLEILHVHSQKEKCQLEIFAAFRAHDHEGTGTVPGPELMHILTHFAEKLSPAEGLYIFVYILHIHILNCKVIFF